MTGETDDEKKSLRGWIVTGGSVAGAVMVMLAFRTEIDLMVVNHDELKSEISTAIGIHLNGVHEGAQAGVDTNRELINQNKQQAVLDRRQSRCEYIDLQISIIDQQIWQMEQDGQASQRLVEKRRELQQLEEESRRLNCSAG